MLKLPFKLPFSLSRLPFRISNWKTPWKIQRISRVEPLPKFFEGIPGNENPGGEGSVAGEGAPVQGISTPKNKLRSPMVLILALACVIGVGLGIWAGASYYMHQKAAEEAALLEAAKKLEGPTPEEILAEYQAQIKEKVGPVLQQGNADLADYDLPREGEGSPGEQTMALETIRIKHLDGLIKTLRRMKVPDGCYDFHSDLLKGLEELKGGAEYVVSGLKEPNSDKLLHGYNLREGAYKTMYPVYYNLLALKPQPESKVAPGH